MKVISTKNLMTILVFLVGVISFAQTGSISGLITDKEGIPLLGVNVSVEGKSMGASTDYDGKYTITGLEMGEYVIVVTYVGFKTQKQSITISGEETLNFTLIDDATQLDDVVITGVLNPKSRLESSVSVSSVGAAEIQGAAPRVTSEIFRSVPGIKSESTGGEGNSNITVRGIPVASGGGKFLQLHEDGLPVMQFGDVAFGNSDIFLRYDQTVSRIEAIRGGSASTLASNSPAGIINFISKTGKIAGGSLSHSIGIDYDNNRTDFEYGTPINESLSFHMGGFFRQGEGPRNTGYTANVGGQFKANLTKEFENGYARFYVKYLNDKAVGYLPMPVQVSGTNANPNWSSLPNFDILHDTPHSPLFLDNLTIGADGQRRRSNIGDGMRPIATSFGGELNFTLLDDWKIEERFRLNFHKGRFVSLFPADVQNAGAYASEFGVSNLTYANGVNAGNIFDNSALAMRIHTFDVDINNFNNFTNDLKIAKRFGDLNISAGYYRAVQNIGMSWLWNSYLMEVKGENAALLNAGSNSTNGLYAYGVPAWGNCCTRNYDAVYDISAPYAGAEYKVNDKINVDASVRFDFGTARGSYAGATQASNLDVNNDGVIQANEVSVSVVDNANRLPINYDFDYVSYSFGANYLLNKNQSVFARHSKGGRANADRLLFGSAVLASGAAINGLSADRVTQTELGFKHKKNNFSVYATGFLANTSEQNWDFQGGSPREIQREYEAYGVELEGYYTKDRFSIGGSVTWTDAKIKSDFFNPEYVGHTPRRQADFIYNSNAAYLFGKTKAHAIGFSVIGTTKSYAQDSNQLIMPGYAYVNPFVKFQVIEGLTASLNINNVFNTIGITEVEEGSITENTNNIVRARSINGRTTALTLSYNF